MDAPHRPWSDHQTLQGMLAHRNRLLAGRPLFRVAAGSDWIRLHLEGDERPAVWLTWSAGANLVFVTEGPPPRVLTRALSPRAPQHPLLSHLKDCRVLSLAMLPDDKVAAVRLENPGGRRLFLLHQLFGSRGNTVLLTAEGRLLWARHRPPGPALARVPDDGVWKDEHTIPERDLVSALALERLVSQLCRQIFGNQEARIGRALKTARRLVTNLTADRDRAEQGDLFRRQAEALAANLHLVKQGQARLETSDLRDGTPLTCDLDPALSPAANLEAFFRRARKADKGHEIIVQRLAEASEQAQRLAAAQQDLQSSQLAARDDGQCADLDCLEDLLTLREGQAHLFPESRPRSRTGAHGPEEPARPFRRFLIDGRYELWVGRNNKENDELTHRASHTRDIWLHAQGVSGSHAILRTAGKPENVPPAVIAKAGAVAAAHSKARHSSLVPVIHTERRYVRKPRKAPPGTAVCLQEKSIFVEPGIPSGVEPL